MNENEKQKTKKTMMIFRDIDKNEIDSSITDDMIKNDYE